MEKISIILPALNEEKNINFIYEKLKEDLTDIWENVEIIFVDDGSSDNTFAEVKRLNNKDKRVRGLQFSRNFGIQSALIAGLKEADGELMVSMDSDGQHPPKLIHEMIEEYRKGFDIVNTVRLTTKDAGWFKKKSSQWFNRLINSISDVKIRFEYSDFRLMNRASVDAFLQLQEQNRFSRGLISWIGFRQSSVSYVAEERHTGETKWTLAKLIRYGTDGITSFSSKPLRISIIIGVAAIVFGIFYSIYAVIVYFIGHTIPGWPSMMITILFLGGFQLLTLGIIGEYIARIFNETKKRPHYFIQEKC